jgi:hypothetical protein
LPVQLAHAPAPVQREGSNAHLADDAPIRDCGVIGNSGRTAADALVVRVRSDKIPSGQPG